MTCSHEVPGYFKRSGERLFMRIADQSLFQLTQCFYCRLWTCEINQCLFGFGTERDWRTFLDLYSSGDAAIRAIEDGKFISWKSIRDMNHTHAEACDRARGINPKDLIGDKKIPVGLVPPAATLFAAKAFAEGARKYGPYNWRENKVRMTVYIDAAVRHLMALRDGQDADPDSGASHVCHVLACAGILADAMAGDFLVDDRPKSGPAARLIAEHMPRE